MAFTTSGVRSPSAPPTSPQAARRSRAILLAAALLLGSIALAADDSGQRTLPAAQRLFHIERSKNANIVAYDVRLNGDGNPDSRTPVDVYWLGDDGKHYPLSAIQRRLAYGVKTRFQSPSVLTLRMAADIGREIIVERIGGVFRAVTDIDGKQAILDHIYVKSVERTLLLPTVEFVDLFGVDPDSGAKRYERIRP